MISFIPYLIKGGLYLLKNPRILAIGGISLVVGFLWLQLKVSQNRLEALQAANANLRSQVTILDTQVQIQKEVDKITSRRLKEQELATKKLDSELDEIDKTPASEDGPVAPVLKKAIDSL